MGVLSCVACSKRIVADPPRCPSCGLSQPDPVRLRRRRALRVWLLSGLAALAGTWAGGRLALRRYARLHPPGTSAFRDPEAAALRDRIRERVARQRVDTRHPYVTLEELQLEPARYDGRPVSVIAFLFSVATPGAQSGRLMAGWGHGVVLPIDLSRLTMEARAEALRVQRHATLILARGTARAAGGGPRLQVETLEFVGREGQVQTVAQLLED